MRYYALPRWTIMVVATMALLSTLVSAGVQAQSSAQIVPSATAPSNVSLDQLIVHLKDQVSEKPKNVTLLNRLGEALMQKGRATGDLDCYTQGFAQFKTALELDNNDTTTLHNMAWACTIHHKFHDAIDYAEQATKIDPQDDVSYGLLSDSYAELGDYDKGLNAAQKMLDLKPGQASYSRAANLRWLYGNTRGAMASMMKAVSAGKPGTESTEWCRMQLGDLYFKTGNIAAAEQQYQIALQRLPDFRHAYAGLARVRVAQRKYEEAAAFWVKATSGTPQIAYVIELGDLYQKMGKLDKAKERYSLIDPLVQDHLKRGIEGDELTVAMFYLDHGGDAKKALATAEEESKEHKSVTAYTTLAWAYYKNGNHVRAKQAIDQAMRLNTQDAQLFYRAAKVYQAAGDNGRASKLVNSAISLNPNFHVLYADEARQSLYAKTPKN